MRFALFAVRRVWITLGSMQYIVESFRASNTGMILFEMSFLMFLGAQEYLRKKKRL
jgi:hypothetical protein